MEFLIVLVCVPVALAIYSIGKLIITAAAGAPSDIRTSRKYLPRLHSTRDARP